MIIRPALTARRLAATAAAMIGMTAVVGCGSSSTGPSGAGPAGGPALAYAECIRAHGVPGFPDPSGRGGLVIPNDINPQSPAFVSAQQACGALGPARSGPDGSSESRKLQLVALARCTRAHGVPSFADPTSSPPPPSSGNAAGGEGWYLALGTARERQSPAYRRAAGACRAGLP